MATKPTHTPGPWTVGDTVKQTQYGQKIYSVEVDGADGLVMAKVIPLTDKVQAEANARLMAAAPELLAAVKEMLDALGPDDGDFDRYPRQAKKMRAAVRKAEGGKRP